MKIALLLLACLIGASYEQGYYRVMPYAPGAWYQPMYNPYHYAHAPAPSPVESRSGSAEVEGNADAIVPEPRLFGNSVVFTLGGLFPSVTSTTTTTSWTTVSSTATTATVISCIPSTYFSASAACRRRRAIFEDSGLSPALLPSPKEAVAPSVAVEEVQREAEPEIQSSQDEIISDPLEKSRDKRYVTTVSTFTVTSTSTSYSFTVTTYTKTLSIGSTTSVLICLPSGLSVCGASG